MENDPCDAIDWNGVWKARQARHAASAKSGDSTHNWDRRKNAARYSENSKGEFDTRVRTTLAGLLTRRSFRVLDIGAGPGTLALPLAAKVREITAIEPGRGMAALLRENMARQGISNITVVEKRWEEVDIAEDLDAPYEIVLSSLALTMEDLRESLAKMDAASSRYVYIFWFTDPPFWERMYIELWPDLHGEPYYPGPKADCLFSILYQMGIYANVEMLPLDKVYRFSTEREMTAFFRRRFGVKTQKQRNVLDKYLAPLIRQEQGQVVISGDSLLAKVWWEKPA